MTKQTIVTEDGRKVEGEKLRGIVAEIERKLSAKDEIVADIRDGYDSAKRKGLNKKALREAIKWRSEGAEAYEAHSTTVAQYMHVLNGVQLDIFATRASAPIFRPKEETPLEATERRAEEAEPDNMRPIGEVASEVVDTLAEMQKQDAAEVAARLDTSPDAQVEAKLAGEVAGRGGGARTDNPHPVTSALHTFWAKGWSLGYQEWEAKNSAENVVTIGKGKTPRKGQPGFVDRNPKMKASDAAAILGGSGSTH